MQAAIIEGEAYNRVDTLQEGFRLPGLCALGLLPGLIQNLMKIPLPVHQGDADHGQFQIGSRAKDVAGQHAQAAGIGRKSLVDGDFHREIGNLPCGLLGHERGFRVYSASQGQTMPAPWEDCPGDNAYMEAR